MGATPVYAVWGIKKRKIYRHNGILSNELIEPTPITSQIHNVFNFR